jgi:hypothetical protein
MLTDNRHLHTFIFFFLAPSLHSNGQWLQCTGFLIPVHLEEISCLSAVVMALVATETSSLASRLLIQYIFWQYFLHFIPNFLLNM